jgi:hypothetical protein
LEYKQGDWIVNGKERDVFCENWRFGGEFSVSVGNSRASIGMPKDAGVAGPDVLGIHIVHVHHLLALSAVVHTKLCNAACMKCFLRRKLIAWVKCTGKSTVNSVDVLDI